MIKLALLSCTIGGLLMLVKVQWKKSPFEKKLLTHFLFLLLGWIFFSLLLGLFQIFDALEFSKDEATSKIVEGLQISGASITLGLCLLLGILYYFRQKARSNK